jgi:putative membrane protein
MNQFQMTYSKVSTKLHEQCNGNGSRKQSHQDYRSQQEQASEDATMKAANRISQAVLHHDLSRKEKEKLGPLVHYAFGTSMGGAYGAIAELRPVVTAGFGTGFATVLFVAGDELAVPALRLSGSPTKSPLSAHVYALASHLVYGLAAEGVRRGVRRVL